MRAASANCNGHEAHQNSGRGVGSCITTPAGDYSGPDFFPGGGLVHDGEIGMGQHHQGDVAAQAGL